MSMRRSRRLLFSGSMDLRLPASSICNAPSAWLWEEGIPWPFGPVDSTEEAFDWGTAFSGTSMSDIVLAVRGLWVKKKMTIKVLRLFRLDSLNICSF